VLMTTRKRVPPQKVSFGERLRRFRRERKLTQMQLAAKIGTDASYVARLETGKIGNPGLESLRRIARVLDLPVSELTGDASSPTGDIESMIRKHPDLDDEAKSMLIRMFRELGGAEK
jgi:transcriptional regulator with XRE-family HTH domain